MKFSERQPKQTIEQTGINRSSKTPTTAPPVCTSFGMFYLSHEIFRMKKKIIVDKQILNKVGGSILSFFQYFQFQYFEFVESAEYFQWKLGKAQGGGLSRMKSMNHRSNFCQLLLGKISSFCKAVKLHSTID